MLDNYYNNHYHDGSMNDSEGRGETMTRTNQYGLRTYSGAYGKFKACALGCADSFKTDRRLGLIYGSFQDEDGSVSGWEETSIECDFCAYCGPSEFIGNSTIHR